MGGLQEAVFVVFREVPRFGKKREGRFGRGSGGGEKVQRPGLPRQAWIEANRAAVCRGPWRRHVRRRPLKSGATGGSPASVFYRPGAMVGKPPVAHARC